jgi:hypothetical protein
VTDPDHYALLGVSDRSEPEVIRAAYRALVRKYHPDSNQAPDATQRCMQLNRAYEVLADPVAREAYDRTRMPVPRTNRAAASRPAAAGKLAVRKRRTSQGEQNPIEFLVGTAIYVVVMTVIIRTVEAVIPHSHRQEPVEHHCMSAPVRGSARVVSVTDDDCPVIETVIGSDLVTAKP